MPANAKSATARRAKKQMIIISRVITMHIPSKVRATRVVCNHFELAFFLRSQQRRDGSQVYWDAPQARPFISRAFRPSISLAPRTRRVNANRATTATR